MMRSPLPSKKENPSNPSRRSVDYVYETPERKPIVLFLCSYGSIVQNPVTDSVLKPISVVVKPRSMDLTPLSTSPDIDQRQADQEVDLRGFDHGGRGVLMP